MNSTVLPFDQSHAFLIGINDYENVSPLSTAVNDANEIAEILREHHGFRVHGPLLNPGKKEILRYLKKTVVPAVGKDDRIFFYYAGHGIALDGETGPNGYLVPKDAKRNDVKSMLPMHEIHEIMDSLDCRHGLLIFDCCFAGAFKWSSGYRSLMFDLPDVIYEERLYQYTQDPAWQVITSSASDQKAVDIMCNRILGFREERDDSPNSPFAQALMDGLMGEADVIPAKGGDGVITATELYTYLRDRVEDETTEKAIRQTPSMFSLGKHDKGQFIFLHPKHRLNLPPMPKRNPYMGLNSYNEEDQLFFYGRDRVIQALATKILEQALTVVSGASGTGKSSVIKAGLIPLMRDQGWQVLPIIRPGQDPLDVLHTEIPSIDEYMSQYTPSLLFIDQYEELVTQCLHPVERHSFEKTLKDWMEQYPLLRVIVSIRSDFEPLFSQTTLASLWNSGRYTVPSFKQGELREVIMKPTLQEVLFFEPSSMVDTLVDAVNQAPGALPLLSFTLSELYHAYINSGRTDRSLTLEDYKKLGGVIGALSMRANAIYDQLEPDFQKSMRKLILRMVFFDGEKNASRRVLEDQMTFTDADETERMALIARQLVNARLLSTGRDEDGEIYFEPAHDALIHSWAQLQQWIMTEGKSKLVLMYKLSLSLADYQDNIGTNKAKDYLWHQHPRLNELYAELQSGDHPFNVAEENFIRQSFKRKIGRKRRSRAWAGATIVLLSIALGISTRQSYTLNNQAQRLQQMQQSSMSNLASLMTSQDINVATKIAVETYEMDQKSLLGHKSLLKAAYKMQVDNGPYTRLERLSDHSTLEFRSFLEENGQIRGAEITDSETRICTWDFQSGKMVQSFKAAAFSIIDFMMDNPDSYPRPDSVSYNMLSTLAGSGETLRYGIYSSDRSRMLGLSTSGKIVVFNSLGKALAHFSAVSPSKSAYFSPSGRYIASEHFDGYLRIWDLESMENTSSAISQFHMQGKVNAIHFSPNGDRLAAVSNNGQTYIHSLKDSSKDIFWSDSLSPKLNTVAFSPDGNHLLTGGSDRRIRIRSSLGKLKAITPPHPKAVKKAQFGFDDTTIYSISYTQLSVFNLQGDSLKTSIYFGRDSTAKHHYVIEDFALSPHGDTLVTVTPWADGARRWTFTQQDFGQPLNGQENQRLGVNLGNGSFTTFSPDGNRFLIGDRTQRELLVYNREETLLFKLKSHFSTPIKAVYSPDNKFIISAYSDNSVEIWDESGEEITAFYPHTSSITDIAVDPAGNYFATSGSDSTVKIWPLSPLYLQQALGKTANQDLTPIEKIAFLNYGIEQFDQDSMNNTDALSAARYLHQHGRTNEAKPFFQYVSDSTLLTIEEKSRYLDFGPAQFIQTHASKAEILEAARYFHREGKSVKAQRLYTEAHKTDSLRPQFTIEEQLTYMGLTKNDFETSTDKSKVLDAARYFIAQDSLLGLRLYAHAETLHGQLNWEAFTPQERIQHLGYDLECFIETNRDTSDLNLVIEYYQHYADSQTEPDAVNRLRQAKEKLIREIKLGK